MEFDTIAAISTPVGAGAIGIIRISGPEAFSIADSIFKPAGHALKEAADKKLVFGHIVDGDARIDEVLLVKMFAPKTYTREDVVEINCHGGVIALREILALILRKGARLAEPGEFTERAFLNGRIDLTQAESIMDLIDAKTKKGYEVALNQLDGSLSKKITFIRSLLMQLMAQLEVSIDYPEEDVEEITYEQVEQLLTQALENTAFLLSDAQKGRIIREGLKAVIVGKPNVGKSSLMNALLRESRAIVTDIPGTTRDVIEAFLNIAGVPIRLYDTAGIRETEDVVERFGVEKSKEHFETADLVLFVLNAAEPISEDDMDIIQALSGKNVIVVINKTDLNEKLDLSAVLSKLSAFKTVRTAIEQSIGLDDLESAIADSLSIVEISNRDLLTNVRHIDLIEKAHKNIADALAAVKLAMPYDFVEVDVKDALINLGKVTGESVESDLLNTIFSNFCLGK
jgi:tRNA modification GTPase